MIGEWGRFDGVAEDESTSLERALKVGCRGRFEVGWRGSVEVGGGGA